MDSTLSNVWAMGSGSQEAGEKWRSQTKASGRGRELGLQGRVNGDEDVGFGSMILVMQGGEGVVFMFLEPERGKIVDLTYHRLPNLLVENEEKGKECKTSNQITNPATSPTSRP